MRLFPAIDIYEGQVVRLYKGDYEQKTVYSSYPVSVALSFRYLGAKYLHLVDLEGAKNGTTPNLELLKQIMKESGMKSEIGGGIRNPDVVETYLSAGAMRVILGTAAIENPEFLKTMLDEYGKRIVVGVDVRDGYIATHGWTECSEKPYLDFCAELQSMGVSSIVCTDISKDGVLKGPNLELYRSIQEQFPNLELVASGGVSCAGDVKALRDAGLHSAILGKSLYEGRLDLREALQECPQEGA